MDPRPASDARLVLGVDVGTSSTKGVVTDLAGTVLRSAARTHRVATPEVGHVEMDANVWWDEFTALARELLPDGDAARVVAVGVSGMGPCVALADEADRMLRPAILYGVDTRAVAQIAEWTERLGGAEAILQRCGSALSTQAAGPKIAWVRAHEPEVAARMRRLYMPSSWLVRQLTGAYVLDRHSASQCAPMNDVETGEWYAPWAAQIAPEIELPRLLWPGEAAGEVTAEAAAATGLPAGVPVIAGTVDAWAEALSVDAHTTGDLMLMYGTTMFLVNTVAEPVRHPALWGTVGALPGTRNLAGGMATSGAITTWLNDLVGDPGYATLTAEAQASGPGAQGLLMLPYFAGERTPLMDPDARGIVAGLTLRHTRGDLYRAALEATAYGVRHNVEVMRAAGGRIDRIVAVGGGTTGDVWTQIVSDVTGLAQVVPSQTIGASYGGAWLAANLIEPVAAERWNPPARVIEPDPAHTATYDAGYARYRELYDATADLVHGLARA